MTSFVYIATAFIVAVCLIYAQYECRRADRAEARLDALRRGVERRAAEGRF